MGFAAYSLQCYFALMLGISGLAKAEQPRRFAMTLYRHGILPRRSVRVVSRLFPWAEIGLACLLVSGVASLAAVAATLLLFVVFGSIETFLVTTKRATECGCYGVAFPQRVDRVSVATSAVLVLLAASALWLTAQAAPVSWHWRLGGSVVFCAGAALLGWRILVRCRSWQGQGQPGLRAEPQAEEQHA